MTTVKATGYVIAQWDYATICMKVKGRGKTGPEAKSETSNPSRQVFDTLRNFGVTDKTLKSAFSLSEQWRHSTNGEVKLSEYEATHKITAFIDNLDKLGELHDALTSIIGIEVESPKLRLTPEHRTSLQEEAFKKAFEKAQQRWNHECKVMGLNQADYYIGSYSTTYDSNYKTDVGGEVSTTADDVLEFHAGAALINVELHLSFWDISRKNK